MKNGDERFCKEGFHAANGKSQCALMKGAVFFFEWGEGFFVFSLSPNVFPSCSHGVPIKFPKSSQVLKISPNTLLR